MLNEKQKQKKKGGGGEETHSLQFSVKNLMCSRKTVAPILDTFKMERTMCQIATART